MEPRTLEINLASAKDLKDVKFFSKMDVYAVVSINGDRKIKTPVHRNGGTDPTWNFHMKFTFEESLARQNRLALEIKLLCQRTLSADKEIGEVHVPIRELLNQPGDGKSFQHVSYQVRKPSGKPKGALSFSYKFGEKFTEPAKASAPELSVAPKVDPVTAYPAPAVGSSSASYPGIYPPPPTQPQYAAGYGYPPPPQAGYGYAPQAGYGYAPQAGYGYDSHGYAPQPGYGYSPQPGYGYPSVPAQKAGKNKFGMGLGAGLLGGALGGLLIGDMISDAGFGDGCGFDF
ncbi:unnamed protein product [Sphenostylis stenocarpa]|uniref:C2 domain-containing protein n=1 Tax=Sphenostylis stenocarpa TaxID=92480 RepID=A0AA86VG47_9FABA|nr:unnamed protein product [Sphenostylis stenocarpa]